MQGLTTGLSSVPFRTDYRSGENDPVKQFYLPCLRNAYSHKRAVGYFRSSVYLVIGPSIIEFARRGGRIHLICSPELTSDDIDVIAEGYEKRSEIVANRLLSDIDWLLADSNLAYPTRVLGTLIATQCLDIRIAMRRDGKGLYHEKIGVFEDAAGNLVSYVGSANETWSAWDVQGNVESIEVFCSWRGGLEAERVRHHQSHFDRLWSNADPHIEVFSFPNVAVDRLKQSALKTLDEAESHWIVDFTPTISALPHQVAAIDAWKANGCRGILKHATGSGKTFTAILAIREHVSAGLPVIVVVPTVLLLDQWADELRSHVPDVALLLAGGGHTRWRSPGRLRGMSGKEPSTGRRIILSTMQTAASELFLRNVAQGPHLLLVADEVHNIGSPRHSRILQIQTGKRLGLSATPERFGDPEGTSSILSYFGGIVPPVITLADAIASGRLVEYEYFPHPITLTEDEAQRWNSFTRQIRQEMARGHSDDNGNRPLSDKAKLLLIQRARIAKKADNKIALSVDVIRSSFREGQRWLVYCEDQAQLNAVTLGLRDEGFRPNIYHSAMEGDRGATMEWFKRFGGILVSIRCLDEGVDIPSVSHALILASSQNPRQFIQRRGRVLRRAPNKFLAKLHDAIVIPTSLEDEPDQISLLKAELLRSIEFASSAFNKDGSAELRAIAVDLGYDIDRLIEAGYEEEADDARE